MSDSGTSGRGRTGLIPGTVESANHVQYARSFLKDFEEQSVEGRYGAILHAIAELENARRELPDDY